MSQDEVSRMRPPLVPLATLIGRELRNEKIEKPYVKYGQAALAKKGEDYFLIKLDCQRVPGDLSTSFSVFAIFDGHNGISAAIFAKEQLLDNVLSAIPQDISREEWLQALPRALVAGFVKTDIEFQQGGETSGTTVTFVIIDGWTVTVASVGDSRCILDSQGGVVSLLTVDHRLEENVEERERVTASGGEVGRLNVFGGNEVGPLRCWPGGLCLSRSIGDTDVGEFIVPIPHVKQVKVSSFFNVNDGFSTVFFLKLILKLRKFLFWLFSFQILVEDSSSLLMVSGMLYLLIWLPSLVGVYLLSLLQSWLLRRH
ncbi:hypothetical protein H0E87_009663 [Populus deltoides]|uniref:PPM-type phosphatase domain-containing protein n=1 Tax=Populus deltoides TaxID=3696 RepID=A0A8T2YQK8_POPDE|nr:hypothetical protein H0E87_009663 [Populus deltoides]